jgi:hypothetical protein
MCSMRASTYDFFFWDFVSTYVCLICKSRNLENSWKLNTQSKAAAYWPLLLVFQRISFCLSESLRINCSPRSFCLSRKKQLINIFCCRTKGHRWKLGSFLKDVNVKCMLILNCYAYTSFNAVRVSGFSVNLFLNYGFITHSAALVRQRTIPTELPPLVGEVSANFSG